MVSSSRLFVTISLISATIGLTACEGVPFSGSSALSSLDKADLKQPLIIDAKLPKATTTIDCAQLTPKQIVKVKGHNVLSASCDLTAKSIRFELNDSHSSLDCLGRTTQYSR